MEKREFYKNLPIFLALLIPCSGRFVIGLTLMTLFFILSLIVSITNSLINKIKLQEMRSVIQIMIMISVTILYKQLLIFTCTEVAFTLGISLYFPMIFLIMVGAIFVDTNKSLKIRLIKSCRRNLFYFFTGLLFFLFRDIFGFGTFTFFGNEHGIKEIIILNSEKIGVLSIFASIPGAMIVAGAILFILIGIKKRAKIIKNMEETK